MQVHNVRYVSCFSELMDGFDEHEDFACFDSSAPFSFGDADHTLVSRDRFLDYLGSLAATDDHQELFDRLYNLDADVFIDVES